MQQKDTGVAASLMRGLEILRTFQADERGLSNNDIVERSGLPKSTVARFTHTLTKLGYLRQQEPLGRFCLGDKVVHFGHALLANLPILPVARPLMQAMADKHGVSVGLGWGDRASMIYIACCHGDDPLRHSVRTGSITLMSETSIGHAFLWALPPARRAWHMAYIGAVSGDSADAQLNAIEISFEDLKTDGFLCSYAGPGKERYAVGTPVVLDVGEIVLGLDCVGSRGKVSNERVRNAIGPELVNLSSDLVSTMRERGLKFWGE